MAAKPSLVGQRIKRREDPRLVRGLATYTDDVKLHGMLHVAFVRSDYANGTILSIDTSAAEARDGVVAVFRYDDMRDDVGRTPCVGIIPGMNDLERPLLADGSVHFVGEPMVAVVARDRYVARDAALDIAVEIDPLPAVTDMEEALAADAPLAQPTLGTNVCFDVPLQEDPAVDTALSNSAARVSLRLVNQRVAPVPMEGRGVIANWEEGPRKLTVWTSSQTPHGDKHQISRCLGIPEHRLRVIVPEVGGGFGQKIPTHAEDCLLGWISRRIGKPVKWVETRTENLLNSSHGRGHVEWVEAGFSSEGRLLALKGRTLADLGAYPSYFGAAIPTFTHLLAPGPYAVPSIAWELAVVYTNTTPTEAYRGAGRPEAAYLIERVMDAGAAELGLDRVEIRRRNLIPKDQFPYTSPTGAVYDSGDYLLTLDKALERFDYSEALAQQERARQESRLVGIGVATFTEICGLGPSTNQAAEFRSGMWESAEVRVEPTGEVAVMTGASPHGQGQETAFAQLVADALGVDIDDVSVIHGDTDVVTAGVGTMGSRGLVVGGTAVYMALGKIVSKATRIAANLLDTVEAQIEFTEGVFRTVGGSREMSFQDVAMAAHVWNVPVPGEEPGLEAVARFEPTGTTFPFGVHLCQVSVDPETGAYTIDRFVSVDDVGTVVNPMLCDGQRIGGIVQGLGQAMCEEFTYDESGQPRNGTLMDYAMPRAHMFPRIELDNTVTPSPLNPLGAKGVGELGTIGSTPCLVSALIDALRPVGVTHLDMPLTPQKVWEAMDEARGGKA